MNRNLWVVQKTTFQFGFVVGVISFCLMLFDYLAFKKHFLFAGYIENIGVLIVLGVGIIFGIGYHKKKELNSPLYFKRSLFVGFIIAFWAGLVYSLLSFFYITLFNSNYVAEMLTIQSINVPGDSTAAESVLARLSAELTYQPTFQLVRKILSSLIWGFLVSLVSSYIQTKKHSGLTSRSS